MHTLLSRFFALALGEVHRYEGTINQVLGDGFMALFGAPIAHEDHARRAVLAAVGIRQCLHAGSTPLGQPEGVEVAAPGQSRLSETTYRLVAGYCTTRPLGAIALKGKATPVPAWEVLAVDDTLFRSRASLCLEHLALRHQLAVYKQTVARPRLRPTDRLFWAWLSRLWSGWQHALTFVQPHTVIAWQHKRFCDHWRRVSQRGKPGRPKIAKDVRDLIRTMWQANPTWGSPRIVGELQKLGIAVAKSTVEKYRVRPKKPPSPTWKTFLKHHVQDLVALDFFVVPTVACRVLFVLAILAHERRRVVHFNVTEHPTATWTTQQVVEAFPWDEAPRHLLRDRDCIYGTAFRQRVHAMGFAEVAIAPRSPGQNPYAERLIGSIRREMLNHVIVLNEQHLKRLLTAYLVYYHGWRTPLSLAMDCPSLAQSRCQSMGG